MRGMIQKMASVVAAISLTGCSLFGPRMQTLTISSDPTGAQVLINTDNVGNTPLRHQVHRGEDVLIEARATGYQTGYRKTNRTLSTLGLVDLLAGCVFVVPFLGLLSSAAWQHEPDAFGITLDPVVHPQPAAVPSPRTSSAE